MDQFTRETWIRRTKLAAAILLLDVSVTFHNIWPTPAIKWTGELSVELAICLAALAIVSGRLGPPSRAALAWLSAIWPALVIGRYADVTAPALYGREVNLFWDLRNVSAVAAMFASAAPLWLILLTLMAAALVLVLLYAMSRWAFGRIGEAMAQPRERTATLWLAAAAVALFATQAASERVPRVPGFAAPVTQTYAHQVRLVRDALSADSRSLAPSPAMDSDLALVKGADVFLFFVESYGAVSYERPEFARGLAASRAEFAAAVAATNRHVVSAYVESPTFGGNSWLAHISLLSGVEVRDRDTNALLMTRKRDTLATAFARQGYRTLALMPGTWQSWPEGAFYGFSDIYGGERLAYRGPQFGWWNIPDQFALAQMDALEVSRQTRAPLFVFFPTVSTHIPFTPTPPYQPDWPRMLTDEPYDEMVLLQAYEQQPDWLDLGPSYVGAMSYVYAAIGGYLRQRADRDFVAIVIGDHQPPSVVSGEGAPWDVPVHVIASRNDVLARLQAHGFRAGLTPARPALSRMHALTPVLLDAFGNREP
ncbi:MAG: sulfatase-like hydrolase/transferase [Vicinamibacterales bacterium]